MNFATLAYVPRPNWGCAQVFLENVRRFKLAHPLILFSDHPYGEGFLKVGNPEPFRVLNERWAINNAVWWTAVRIAVKQELTHFLYLESDCRIAGDLWDGAIYEDWTVAHGPSLTMAGTPIVWNPFNSGLDVAKRWEKLIVQNNRRKNVPIATYGVRDTGPCKVFVCGALGIYDVAWLARTFDLDNTSKLCSVPNAWDHMLGEELWKQAGIEAFNQVGILSSVYSSFGNETTTEEERLAMLKEGKVRGVHQIKSGATI